MFSVNRQHNILYHRTNIINANVYLFLLYVKTTGGIELKFGAGVEYANLVCKTNKQRFIPLKEASQ